MRRRSMLVTTLMLAACGPQSEPQANSDLNIAAAEGGAQGSFPPGPLSARGTEPFWAIDVEGETMTLTRPDHPVLKQSLARNSDKSAVQSNGASVRIKADVSAEEFVWRAGDLNLRASPGACSDGMSDLTYPMSAELKLGSETLKGCAFFKGDPPKQP
jgi:uncharacterized membrane protein